jgi:hypothetical protein
LGFLIFYHGDGVGVGSPQGNEGTPKMNGKRWPTHTPYFGPLPMFIIFNKKVIVFPISSINEL